MKAVIMAGGKGTRIASIVANIPKPMIKIANKPVLEYEIECLREQGFTDLILTVSYLSDIIMDYFGDGSKISPATGKSFGVNITYYIEKQPLGNAGALLRLKNEFTEDFLLLNADIVFDVDFNRMVNFHKEKGALVTLFTHPNTHPYDSGVIIADKDLSVKEWYTKEDKRPEFYRNRVNAGLHVINPQIFEMVKIETGGTISADGLPTKVDLDRQILKPLSGSGVMFCYDSPEYVSDMGTPERFLAVEADFVSGYVRAKNLSNRQKAIFLDRDGTINKYVGFLRDKKDFELLDGVAEAIKKINKSGYLCIVVTNQPVIARGEITEEELHEIHNKMETMLGYKGAYVDSIYYCPHHPDRGYEGEIIDLKRDCECRKPKPGMLLKAAKDYNIDLGNSWMVGDSVIDIMAGKAAGCKTALINKDFEMSEKFIGNLVVSNILEFVEEVVCGKS